MWSIKRRTFILNSRKAAYEAREPEMRFILCHAVIQRSGGEESEGIRARGAWGHLRSYLAVTDLIVSPTCVMGT